VVVIPTYNEASNLPRLLETIFGLDIEGLHVLVADDNSPDKTGELVEQLAQEKYSGCLEVIHRPSKMGLGTAYINGFGYALKQGATHLVEMDADFSHDPAVLKQFWQAVEHYDVVIGSRYVSGGSIDEQWSWLRRFISKGGSIYARAILGLKVQDTTAGFKMFRAEALQKLPLAQVRSNGYAFQVEMAYLCQKNQLLVKEVPIHFKDRTSGQSKMSLKITLEAAWRVWQIKFRY